MRKSPRREGGRTRCRVGWCREDEGGPHAGRPREDASAPRRSVAIRSRRVLDVEEVVAPTPLRSLSPGRRPGVVASPHEIVIAASRATRRRLAAKKCSRPRGPRRGRPGKACRRCRCRRAPRRRASVPTIGKRAGFGGSRSATEASQLEAGAPVWGSRKERIQHAAAPSELDARSSLRAAAPSRVVSSQAQGVGDAGASGRCRCRGRAPHGDTSVSRRCRRAVFAPPPMSESHRRAHQRVGAFTAESYVARARRASRSSAPRSRRRRPGRRG